MKFSEDSHKNGPTEFSMNAILQPLQPSVAKQDPLLQQLSYVRESAWFVLKDSHRYGPFPYADIVRLLQAKELHASDYVWRPEIKDWQHVSQLPEFAPETLRALLMTPEWREKGVFSKRQYPRFSYGTSIIAHNMQQLFRGRSMEVGLGGAGVLIDRPDLSMGSEIKLHFKPGTELPAFNVNGAITSRIVLPPLVAGSIAQFKYGVKFQNLDPKAFGHLVDYFSRIRAA